MEIKINISKILNYFNIIKHIKNKIIKDDLNILKKWNEYITNLNEENSTCYLLTTNIQIKYGINKFYIIHAQSNKILGTISYFFYKIKPYKTNILDLIFLQYNISIDWNKKLIKRFSNNVEIIIGKPISIYYNVVNNSFAFLFNDINITNEFKIKIRNCSGILQKYLDTLNYILL